MQADSKTNTLRAADRGRVRKLTVTAMLSAVAFVLLFLDFPIPMIMPSFVKMDFSDLPELLGAFALGPTYGVLVCLLKNLIHLLVDSSTNGVGELCNFLFGAVFAWVAGFVYQRNKSRRTAVLGAVLGSVAMAIVSVPLNYYLTYPAYVVIYGMPLDVIIGMYQAILPSADGLLECLVIFNMPWTLAKGLLDAVLCMLIYKPLSPILHGRR